MLVRSFNEFNYFMSGFVGRIKILESDASITEFEDDVYTMLEEGNDVNIEMVNIHIKPILAMIRDIYLAVLNKFIETYGDINSPYVDDFINEVMTYGDISETTLDYIVKSVYINLHNNFVPDINELITSMSNNTAVLVAEAIDFEDSASVLSNAIYRALFDFDDRKYKSVIYESLDIDNLDKIMEDLLTSEISEPIVNNPMYGEILVRANLPLIYLIEKIEESSLLIYDYVPLTDLEYREVLYTGLKTVNEQVNPIDLTSLGGIAIANCLLAYTIKDKRNKNETPGE